MNLRAYVGAALVGTIMILTPSLTNAQQSEREIVVVGVNTQSPIPTVLRIDLTALSIGPSAEKAAETAAKKAKDVIKDFRKFGLEKRDWSEHRALTRKGLPDEPKRLAFWATVTLTVHLSDFSAAAEMLDRAHEQKLANVHFEFELDDPAVTYETALERAIDDARRRAQVISRELNVTLGPPLGCEELSMPPEQNSRLDWSAVGSSQDEHTEFEIIPYANQPAVLNPHPIEVSAQVKARFAIVR